MNKALLSLATAALLATGLTTLNAVKVKHKQAYVPPVVSDTDEYEAEPQDEEQQPQTQGSLYISETEQLIAADDDDFEPVKPATIEELTAEHKRQTESLRQEQKEETDELKAVYAEMDKSELDTLLKDKQAEYKAALEELTAQQKDQIKNFCRQAPDKCAQPKPEAAKPQPAQQEPAVKTPAAKTEQPAAKPAEKKAAKKAAKKSK